jgi:hypothetical protein
MTVRFAPEDNVFEDEYESRRPLARSSPPPVVRSLTLPSRRIIGRHADETGDDSLSDQFDTRSVIRTSRWRRARSRSCSSCTLSNANSNQPPWIIAQSRSCRGGCIPETSAGGGPTTTTASPTNSAPSSGYKLDQESRGRADLQTHGRGQLQAPGRWRGWRESEKFQFSCGHATTNSAATPSARRASDDGGGAAR